MQHRVRGGSILVALSMLVVMAATPVLAGSATWKLQSFNRSGQALRAQVVDVSSAGAVTFTFPSAPDAAYLTSAKVPSIGALSARVSIAADTGTTFAYYPTGADAKVGLYFQSNNAGPFDPSDYWWSSDRVLLSSLVDHPTLLATALADPSAWTNFYGQPGTLDEPYEVNGVTYPSAAAGFAAAIADIDSWGVSFGGGSFYANGVGTPTGHAVFSLQP